jgi:hypothetical protein
MALELTYNRNEYQKSSWGGGGNVLPARRADNLTAICEPITDCLENVGSTSHNPIGLQGVLQG